VLNNKIRVLLIEDDPGDVRLIQETLSGVPDIVLEYADRLQTGYSKLEAGNIDIVLLDLGLPDSQGIAAIKSLCETFRNMPVVVFTGLLDEQVGIQAVREGAQDYLVKGQTNGVLLAKAIFYSIERKQLENERERLIRELQESIAKVKLLSGLLPICASCKKIRDDKGYWNQVEAYISKHSQAKFTHGICPDCVKKLYPDYYDKIYGSENNKT
jgi:CheY-like chemotaxis protein